MSDNTYRPTVELYLRALCPVGSSTEQSRVIDQLQGLRNRDRIADLSIDVWGDRLEPATARKTARGRRLLDRIDTFQHWGRRNDVSLDSFRWRQAVTNVATEESITVVSLPTMALAEFVDGELCHLTPCTRDGVTQCVSDRVEQLADPSVTPGREQWDRTRIPQEDV